jgi:hypothetical protein
MTHMGAARNVARTSTEGKRGANTTPGIESAASAPSRRHQLLGALALASDAQAIATLAEAYVLEKHREVNPSVLHATTRIVARIAQELGRTLCDVLDRDERRSGSAARRSS